MSTLADELLQDFEDSGSEAGEDNFQDEATGLDVATRGLANGRSSDAMDIDGAGSGNEDDEERDMEAAEDADDAKAKVEKMQLGAVNDVRSVAGLMQTLDPVLEVCRKSLSTTASSDTAFTFCSTRHSPDDPILPQKIEKFQSQAATAQVIGNIEDHPEYHLLTQSNSLSTLIDGEIMLVHKYIRDHYSVRFPELETLINNPLEYAKVVAILADVPISSNITPTVLLWFLVIGQS